MKRLLEFLSGFAFIKRLLAARDEYVGKLYASGTVHPPSSLCWYFFKMVFLAWQIIQVGRVRVVNPRNLRLPGRVIYCPNHGSFLDAIVMQPVFPKPMRGIGAFEVFRWGFGLIGFVMSRLGVIPVDRSQGKTVLGPATKVVADGDSMVIFPEGKVSVTGELLPFKLGPAYIATAVYEQLQGREEVWIVPVRICYGRRDQASATNFMKMGFKWRGGATVTLLEPIRVSQVKDCSPEQIMQMVRCAITSVSCASEPPSSSCQGFHKAA